MSDFFTTNNGAPARVHAVGGGAFVLSVQGVWKPGAYESAFAAKRAADLSDAQLRELQDSVSPAIVTLAMLDAA